MWKGGTNRPLIFPMKNGSSTAMTREMVVEMWWIEPRYFRNAIPA